MVGEVASHYGRIDILVNNARAIIGRDRKPVTELTEEVWHRFLAINTTAPFLVTKFVAPVMIKSGRGGRIINMGSDASKRARANTAAYTTSKHGVLGFTRALAAELGRDGVRVNAIGPGFIETPLNERVRATNPELVKVFIDHTPLGRAGTPDDIVGPAIFLASDLSAYVTGSIVMADGGYRTV